MYFYPIFLFPLGALLISGYAYFFPETLSGYVSTIVPLLGVVMFCMGMSLKPSDFQTVLLQPRLIAIGVFLQYLLMPFIAWCLALGLGLSAELATGLILIGACPGGTASNVICYLARGNVALSIMLTAVSTLVGVFLTPVMTYLYVDHSIHVPIINMIESLLLIVILPVLGGVLINYFFQPRLAGINKVLPLVSMLSVILIIGIIVARNSAELQNLALLLVSAVVLHNLLGMASGYGFARLLRYDKTICKTLAIEVGMQNSGLGIVLANQYFSPIAALPGVLFSIWHNVSGAILASIWNRANTRSQE